MCDVRGCIYSVHMCVCDVGGKGDGFVCVMCVVFECVICMCVM